MLSSFLQCILLIQLWVMAPGWIITTVADRQRRHHLHWDELCRRPIPTEAAESCRRRRRRQSSQPQRKIRRCMTSLASKTNMNEDDNDEIDTFRNAPGKDEDDDGSSSCPFNLVEQWQQAKSQGKDVLSNIFTNANSSMTNNTSDRMQQQDQKQKQQPREKKDERASSSPLSDILPEASSQRRRTVSVESFNRTKGRNMDKDTTSFAPTNVIGISPLIGWLSNVVPNGEKEENASSPSVVQNFLSRIVSLASGDNDDDSGSVGSHTITSADDETIMLDSIITRAREEAHQSSTTEADFQEILDMLNMQLRTVRETLRGYLGDLEDSVSLLRPASLYYYLEYQDEQKNPSWKRRMHRYYPSIDDMSQIDEIYDAALLGKLVYADTKEEILQGLDDLQEDYELIYYESTNLPNQPTHFIVIDRGQSLEKSEALEVVLVIRGTKTLTDVVSDLLCEAVDYRDGFKAHAGMLESGTYVAEQHASLLETLCDLTDKENIALTIIGHSLGAGAASIAAIELNEVDNINAKVVGFGCPPLLSLQLAEDTKDFITAVVGDADIVPRLSPACLVNAVLDVTEFDWIPRARRDIRQLFQALQGEIDLLPAPDVVTDLVVTEENVAKAAAAIDRLLGKYFAPTIKSSTDERLEQELFVPGTCIHLYKDGIGISPSVVPCTFFSELDISRSMIRDHLLRLGYEEILFQLRRQNELRNNDGDTR